MCFGFWVYSTRSCHGKIGELVVDGIFFSVRNSNNFCGVSSGIKLISRIFLSHD